MLMVDSPLNNEPFCSLLGLNHASQEGRTGILNTGSPHTYRGRHDSTAKAPTSATAEILETLSLNLASLTRWGRLVEAVDDLEQNVDMVLRMGRRATQVLGPVLCRSAPSVGLPLSLGKYRRDSNFRCCTGSNFQPSLCDTHSRRG
jgi:hypothetical protein